MKKSLLTGIILVMALGLFAQSKQEKKSAFSIGAEAIYPVKQYRYNRGLDFGGSLQQEFLVKKTGITFNLGIASASHLDSYANVQGWLMAGARYYFTNNVFVGGQLGGGAIVGDDSAVGTFNYSGGAGVKFKPVDVSLYYRGLNISGKLYGTTGIRVGILL